MVLDAARKAQLVRGFQRYVVNPPVRALSRLGLAPGSALLETVGRKSGLARQVPVSNGLEDGRFWIVAEHGRRADYVRNIEVNPRVRVRVGPRWMSGLAHVLPGDDVEERLRMIPALNRSMIRAVATDLLTIRIDLDP